MNRLHRLPRRTTLATLCCAAICLGIVVGCSQPIKPPTRAPDYPVIGQKQGVPSWMHNTVWEKVDVGNTDKFQVSGFGLVVNLDNTGDTTAPIAVREYIIKLMLKHGYGSKLMPGWERQSPERVLHDKRVAIVQVIGELPAGIREGQQFDVAVQCLPKNLTSSLAGGELYMTDLKINGADPHDPFSKINDYAVAKGFVFVNPVYALNKDTKASSAVRASLRNGVVMDGCRAKYDRPILLRLRSPEKRIARYIEQRIIERFQDTKIAQAENEAIVQIFVPYSYNGNWEHFTKLVTHLYMDGSPENLASKARQLVAEAVKPDAKLDDISYCWEGIGQAALPYLAPLLMDKRPDVCFAAARAGAFVGDPTGASMATLLAIARDSSHPMQLNAVETLGALPPSGSINEMLRQLLDTDRALVRIEAYKLLVRNHDTYISTEVVTKDPSNQKFLLDIVPSQGKPMIYATRTGTPRIALIGPMAEIKIPVMYAAMDDRLTISSRELGENLTIFYRTPAMTDPDGRVNDFRMADPVRMLSQPSLAAVIQRLGGNVAEGERPLNFTYSEVLAILQGLNAKKSLAAEVRGQQTSVAFVLQDPSPMQDTIYSAPSIDTGRPHGEDNPKISQTSDPAADAALSGLGRK